MKLSDQQLRFYRTFGYLGFPVLMADRIGDITDEFEAVWERHGGGHDGRPHEGTARSCLVPFVDQSEYLSSLLDDPRILGIAYALVGDDFNYIGSDGNYYVGDTGWHSDGWYTEELSVKIAFYLDPLTRDTGALRVIPGSHLPGDAYADTVQDKVGRSHEVLGVPGSAVPAIALETSPGDIVCFNHNTKHSAWGGGTRRRMFTLNLSERFPEHRLEVLRQRIAGAARYWAEEKYGEAMVRTAGPERMRHLEQCLANSDHLPELSRQARERMSEPSRG